MRIYLFCLPLFLLSCDQKTSFYNFSKGDVTNYNSSSEEWEREYFTLDEKQALIDILIVADTSPSMFHHLNDLGRSLSSLLSVISHYDWQIGITSADHGDHHNPLNAQETWKNHVQDSKGRFGCLMNLENNKQILQTKILNSKVPNYDRVFYHSLSHDSQIKCQLPPYCHAQVEQPLRSLKSAIQRVHLDNRSFFRSTADFVSIIITNEEERAEDRERATSAQEVVQTFNNTFSHLDKKFIAFNILVMDKDCYREEKRQGKASHIAYSIAELAELTGGYNISICSPDYGSALAGLSRYIKNSLENSILLKKEPIPGTVQVEFINGQELKWKQYGRNIVFENRNSRTIETVISYKSWE